MHPQMNGAIIFCKVLGMSVASLLAHPTEYHLLDCNYLLIDIGSEQTAPCHRHDAAAAQAARHPANQASLHLVKLSILIIEIAGSAHQCWDEVSALTASAEVFCLVFIIMRIETRTEPPPTV